MTAIKSHLPAVELEHRYKTASEAIAKSHFHALWLLARGYSIDQVAGLLSFSTRWVRAFRLFICHPCRQPRERRFVLVADRLSLG